MKKYCSRKEHYLGKEHCVELMKRKGALFREEALSRGGAFLGKEQCLGR